MGTHTAAPGRRAGDETTAVSGAGALLGAVPLPVSVTVNLTHRCNFACGMCTQYGGKFKNATSQELSLAEWTAFFESIAWSGMRVVLFGGEPTLYPHFGEIVTQLGRLHIPFDLVTNGFFLAEHVEQLAESQARVFVSIDGPREVHNRIRHSRDSFARLEAALRCLRPLRKNTTARPFLGINCVMQPDNVNHLGDLLAFAMTAEPDAVSLQHPQYSSPQLNHMTDAIWRPRLGSPYSVELLPKVAFNFDEDYLRRLTRAVATVRATYADDERVVFLPDFDADELRLYYSESSHFFLRPGQSCTLPWTRPTIDPNGDVSLCLDAQIGNVTTNDFWALWDSAAARLFRRTLSTLERFPVCTRCCALYVDESAAAAQEGTAR